MIELKDLEKKINSGLTTNIKSSKIKFNQLVIYSEIEDIFEVISFLKNKQNAIGAFHCFRKGRNTRH